LNLLVNHQKRLSWFHEKPLPSSVLSGREVILTQEQVWLHLRTWVLCIARWECLKR